MSGSELFRAAALERSLHRVVGEVTLATPISSKILTVAACGVLVLGLLFASFSEYSRRETVTGWLAPEHGMVRIVATTGCHYARPRRRVS